MTGNVNLTIKIDPALKELLKTIALENQTSISAEVSKRLEASLKASDAAKVDSQDVAEDEATTLTAAEVKQLRSLIKKKKKK
ncbi:hypothetical protein CIG19_06990 [Enterobacterales bacterium CwR94]|nr:hypothetical protein CIG19_06990 [Enterobacterales bacterium CwR94]